MNDNDKLLSILKNAENNFDKETQKEIEQIWERTSDADPAGSVDVSEREVSEAYRNVKAKIHSGRPSESSENSGSFVRYAAAAVFLLFAAGLAYILIPVTVSIPHGQIQTVNLPDQSTVQLNSGSEITYSRLFGIWEREVTLHGEAFFDVQSDDTSFRVTTGNASIEVMGTKFNVRYWSSEVNNRTSVFLSEGMVTFKSLLTDNESTTLKAGEQSWVSDVQQKPVQPVTTDKEKAIAWQHDSMAFEDQPLSAIFGELERRFDITINGHPDIMNENITIYLSDIENIESALKDICRTKGLTYKKQNEKFLVYRN